MSRDPDRLAVYGTLVPGGPNGRHLDGLEGEWSRGTVRGIRVEDGWHGYPGVVLADAAAGTGAGPGVDPDVGAVEVAVLRSAGLAAAWERLDAFEGPGYRRVVTDVTLDDGRVVAAHVYELVHPPRDLHRGGHDGP